MMDRTRPWTEQEGLGSAGSSVAAPPRMRGCRAVLPAGRYVSSWPFPLTGHVFPSGGRPAIVRQAQSPRALD